MTTPLLPGTWLGLLGGGQLGRMFVHAAQALGYPVMVLDPGENPPAAQAADAHLRADYDDAAALDRLAERCAAVTLEFENVPAESLERLAAHCRLAPGPEPVAIARDRLREKGFLRDHGIATAPFAEIADAGDVAEAVEAVGLPARLKTATLGYDGKGQVAVDDELLADAAFQELGRVPCVLERQVALAREFSVVLARGFDGTVTPFPVVENRHRHGILDYTLLPAAIPEATAAAATDLARRVADALDYHGVLAVELFETTDGEVLVNELAPRPHNSGHITQDACITSQFEQQVRMLCGLPAGSPEPLTGGAMLNLLGERWAGGEPDWPAILAHPAAKLHLYGKAEARPGRKMGHINCLDADPAEALATAEAIDRLLGRTEG
ncbi:5-(carboxyamino)imidazole ribonucleotide synthase [Thiohalospira halophila DSM 15071]|uniref:N5-carboxyaminoimidazole ribonucleotide synthase n=1 Tax=Thiohalospira halophila DSM 15071 TaxID=1123397 RepID=A0A1I1SDU4_9GAMM|nr:5-(carboxyamino)imidazole ribonucleotide synthase [Thiohalospira halophila]SFD44621.1 5-(carboxyamino)imidazole ribonucleotide synthase [Thiohalospira halophila DSM 15071]